MPQKNVWLYCLLVFMVPRYSLAAVVFWGSDPVEPNETVVLAGADLDGIKAVRVTRLVDASSQSISKAMAQDAPILQSSAHTIKFLLPQSLGRGIYRYELLGGRAAVTGLLNAASVYWMQGDAGSSATVGGWVRVLGRNISRTTDAVLELASADGKRRLLKASDADMWSASFSVPADMASGRYEARLWNGNGDASTWRTAGVLSLTAADAAPSFTVSVASLGASGNDNRDDTEILAAAMQQVASHGGGTVYLSRGYYRVSSALRIPPHVSLKGAGKDATSIVWDDFDNPPPVLLQGSSDFSVEDLTLAASQHMHILHGGFPEVAGGPDGANITIRRVRIRASSFFGHLSPADAASRMQAQLNFARNGADSIGLAGRNLVIEDCDVYGSGRSLYLLRPVGARVSNNVFSNGRHGWYSISGADGVLFEGNRIIGADMESTGGGINTMFAGTAYSQNVLFRKNTIESIYGWDREALTTDGPGGFYHGSVDYRALTASSELVLRNPTVNRPGMTDWRGAGVFIIGGKGMGQYARAVSRDGSVVKLDRPFAVAPDSSSVLTIVPMQLHYLILDNSFSDAAFAVQLFGTAVDHVISGNVSDRTGGFASKALFYQHVQPTWYNQFLGNEIRTPSSSAPSALLVGGQQKDKSGDVLGYVSVLRNNRLLGNASVILRGDTAKQPVLSDILVEGNTIHDARFGVSVEAGVVDYLIRDNHFSGVDLEVKKAAMTFFLKAVPTDFSCSRGGA